MRLSPHTVRAIWLGFGLSIVLSGIAVAGEVLRTDTRYAFRTDFANAHLPWYQPKPLEFPPHHSDRRIGGEKAEFGKAIAVLDEVRKLGISKVAIETKSK